MRDLDELLTDEPSRAAADHVHPPALAELRARGVRRRRTRRAAYVAGVAAVVAAVAIGAAVLPGDGSKPEPAPAPGLVGMIELADRVYTSGGHGDVAAVDLTAARERLGLPADAVPGSGRDPARQDLLQALFAIPHLGTAAPSVLGEAIDAGQISAGASALIYGSGSLAVLSTSQDFDAIANELESAGYVRSGNLLKYVGAGSGPTGAFRYLYVAGDNGLLAFSSDSVDGAGLVLEAVVAEPPPRTEWGAVLGRIQAATGALELTLVDQNIGAAERECVPAVVVTDSFGGGDDEVFLISNDPAKVEVGDLEGYGTPVVGRDWIQIPFEDQRSTTAGGDSRRPAGLEWQCG